MRNPLLRCLREHSSSPAVFSCETGYNAEARTSPVLPYPVLPYPVLPYIDSQQPDCMLLIYQILITLVLSALLGMTLYNLRRLLAVPVRRAPADAPLVSVLVPARNEERNIRTCVESLLAQRYDRFEVVVLNDNSTDATGDILRDLAERHPDRLRVIDGAALPPGWVGKNWACHQLYETSRGDILLFTDADTAHEPDALPSTVALLHERDLDCLSVIPHEHMGTLAEKMVLPLVHLSFLAYLPIDAVMKDPRVPIGAANGQFMMFRRSVYEEVGGHKALKTNIVEDIFFARRLKSFGRSVFVADASHLVSCRMYTSFREVVAGFSKNLFPAMSARLPVFALYLVMNTSLFAAPPVFAVWALLAGQLTPELFALPVVQTVLGAAMRGVLAVRFRMSMLQIVLQPPAALLAMAISANSVLWYYSSRGMQWKGRQYDSSLVASE